MWWKDQPELPFLLLVNIKLIKHIRKENFKLQNESFVRNFGLGYMTQRSEHIGFVILIILAHSRNLSLK